MSPKKPQRIIEIQNDSFLVGADLTDAETVTLIKVLSSLIPIETSFLGDGYRTRVTHRKSEEMEVSSKVGYRPILTWEEFVQQRAERQKVEAVA